MRGFWDWIADNAVPILGGAAVVFFGGAIGAAYAGYYAVAGIAGGLSLASGVGAVGTHVVNQNRRIDRLIEQNGAQARTIRNLQNDNTDVVNDNNRLLNENRALEQWKNTQQQQIDTLTRQRDEKDEQINILHGDLNTLRRRTTDDSFQIRALDAEIRQLQNERDRLNRQINVLEIQAKLPTVPPPAENNRVSQNTAGTFGPRPVHRRNRNDGEGYVNNLIFD